MLYRGKKSVVIDLGTTGLNNVKFVSLLQNFSEPLNMQMCTIKCQERQCDAFSQNIWLCIFSCGTFHMTSFLRLTLGIGLYLCPLLNNHHPNWQRLRLSNVLASVWCTKGMVQCRQPLWAHNGQSCVLSMTSHRIVASELVGNTASCPPGLPNVQYPGGRGHFTGAFVSTKSRCTQSCVLAFPSRRLSANLEKLRRFSPSQSMSQTATMDVQWPPDHE